jgi:UDP-glucose 4-epimerase
VKVLVTGAGGLIGRHIVEACRGQGLVVVAVGRGPLPESNAERIIALDLRHPDSAAVLETFEPTVIVHAAAVLPQRFSDNSSDDAAKANRTIDDLVMKAAAGVGCQICYISGTSLYGCVDTTVTEESPVQPRGPYLAEKRHTEERLLALHDRSVVLRVSAVYGPSQRSTTVLQTFIRKALLGEDVLFFGSGSREQDFVAVEDVARAVVAALTSSVTGMFNVASGRAITMRDLAHLVVSSLGSASRVRAAGVEDPQEGCAARYSIEKAKREMSWAPAVMLEAGIQQLAMELKSSPSRVADGS